MKGLKTKLVEKMKALPEPSPVPSPTPDAPSPENSDDEDLALPDAAQPGKIRFSVIKTCFMLIICFLKYLRFIVVRLS